MEPKASTDYDVDNRYRGLKTTKDDRAHGKTGTEDDQEGKRALAKALAQRRISQRPSLTQDRKEDDHFIVSGPGDTMYRFKNSFGAPRSPAQRRLGQVNQ
jgi:hypothetical protein